MDRATATLGTGTLNIISDTRGVLSPIKMRNFLNQVRGRKKAVEIAGYFTSNIPALVKQLKDVETNYHRQGRRGSRMDKDIDFIRRLHKRLDSSGDRCGNNDDCFGEYHNEVAYHSRSPDSARKKLFASTSIYERMSNKGATKQSNRPQGMSYSTNSMNFASTGNNFQQSSFASTSSCTYTPPKPKKKTSSAQRLNPGVRNIAFNASAHLSPQASFHFGMRLNLESKQKSAAAAKIQSSGRRKASLSSGTIKIISNTRGPLNPYQLRQFLNEVRGKKKATEIASQFTANIPALINQLQEVNEIYSRLGRKGVRMKKDIDFIRRLRLRLQEDRNKDYATEVFSRQAVLLQDIKEEYSTDESSSSCSSDSQADSGEHSDTEHFSSFSYQQNTFLSH